MLKSNIKRTSTMMKRLFPTALAVLLLLLAGCTAKPDTSDQSKPTDYYLTDTDLPLDDAARLRAAPDFLTAEQQTLYRQAFALYSAMFDGETTGIDDAFPAAGGQTEYDEYTPDGSDYFESSDYMEIANETLPKSIEAKEVSALFCRARHASGAHILFERMLGKKRSTGSNKRSGYHPKSVCIG